MIDEMGKATRRALVLAGGSFAASAWESGLLAGMASAGVDLRDADLFIGTSAGARVALHLATGTDLSELFEQTLKPIHNLTSPPRMDWPSIRREAAEAKAAGGTLDAILKRFGKIALNHASLGPAALEARRETMAAQLPTQTWPVGASSDEHGVPERRRLTSQARARRSLPFHEPGSAARRG